MNALAPLRIVPFRFLLAGRTINSLGNAIAPVALAFAVLDLTGSPRDLGLVVGARVLVNVLFLLFGGALADRLPKHLLMVGASIAAAVTQAAVAALVLSGTATVALLIALSAVNGMVSALALPASSSIVPQLVPADLRQQANALSRLLFNGAFIVGAPIGGVLVAGVGPGWGIAVDAAAFALSAIAFALLRLPPRADEKAERTSIFTELRTGWTEFRSRTWLWVVVAGFGVINACISGGLNVLGPVVADDTVGRKAWGFVLAAQTAGMLLGAILALRIRLSRLLFFGVACMALEILPMVTLGVVPHLGLLLGAAFLAGVGVEQFGVAWETTIQEHVPADKLARVYSYDMVGSFVAIPIGQVAAGPIAEAVGIEPTLVGTAALIGLAVIGMVSSRDVRNLRHRLPTSAKAADPTMEESTP
ncbi:MFS transporter [Actinoplanes friuliensis]|uniref:YfiS-like MFS-type transporter n=1 Tax=Actinoplanes friuliensis DSM 7358 TaxID=1246995 RepID=U5VNQ6_9ACTN|nr:MFS transporter [Actinoplanes friuliensis]AGZ38429.1 yfiS-like MFS-type transporter [Actinoplanes friuliensis DSM 7358]